MKDREFLQQLYNEGKFELVEPSENIKESYLKKSESYLSSAKLLYANGKLEESVSMSYYSMYYLVLALLYKTGIKSETHAGSITIIKDVMGVDISKINKAKKERIDKQYYVDFSITSFDAQDLIKSAEEFSDVMTSKIARLSREDVKVIRKKLEEIVKDA